MEGPRGVVGPRSRTKPRPVNIPALTRSRAGSERVQGAGRGQRSVALQPEQHLLMETGLLGSWAPRLLGTRRS